MTDDEISNLLKENQELKKRVAELENLPDILTGLNIIFTGQIYQTLLRLSPIGILITNFEDGTIIDTSYFFCETTGFIREKIIGKTTIELGFWSPQDRDNMKALLSREGKLWNMEKRRRKKDGAMFTSLEFSELITIGDKCCIVLVAMDISSLKDSQDALLKERGISNTLIDSLPGLFFIVDENYRFLRWNDNFVSITGYSPEELSKMTIFDFHREAERSVIQQETQKVFDLGEHSAEAELIMKNGTVKTFFFSSKRITYDNKPCVLGSAFDITVQKHALEELSHSSAQLQDVNTALRVLLNENNSHQNEIEEKLQHNINELVISYLKKLKSANLDQRHRNYLLILERNLNEILSPFMKNILSFNNHLTPQEIQIVDLIGKGKNTKEISDLLNTSVNTIATHRNNIRKKMNLRNTKINLRTHLLSIKK